MADILENAASDGLRRLELIRGTLSFCSRWVLPLRGPLGDNVKFTERTIQSEIEYQSQSQMHSPAQVRHLNIF